VSLVASLRANSSIPYSIIPLVIESSNEITNTVVEQSSVCLNVKLTCLLDAMKQFSEKLKEHFEQFKQPLQFLDSRYILDTFLQSTTVCIAPVNQF
jgi:hypothetical protein